MITTLTVKLFMLEPVIESGPDFDSTGLPAELPISKFKIR